jgi:hypothetical protein
VRVAILAGLLAAAGCANRRALDEYAGTPTVVNDTVLRFPGGAEFISGLHAVEYLGRVEGEGGTAFLVVGGVECSYCDAPPSVLVRSPAAGRVRTFRGTPGLFPYPGRIRSWPDTTVLVRETRVFWGRCAYEGPPIVVEHSTDYAGNQPMRHTISGVILDRDSVRAAVGETHLPQIWEVVDRVNARRCHEVPPRHRFVDP